MMTATRPYPGTQAVQRALALLKVFTDDRPVWSLTELSSELGLNKSTVFRLLSALEHDGMVARTAAGDAYLLGPEIVTLGGRALRNNDLRKTSRPELDAMASATGETASLEIYTDDEVLIIDEVVGDRLMSGSQSIGTRWPLHVTSTGMAILAALPAVEAERILAKPLLPFTDHSITDPAALRRELQRVRNRGYGINDEMLEPGFIAIGAVVRNFDRQVIGAISLGGPRIRIPAGRVAVIGQMVVAAAERISVLLGS